MKYIISVLMVSLCISMASAQDVYTSSGRPQHAKKDQQQKGFDRDRLIFGAGAVVGFGNGYADLGVSPFVGYRFTDHFSAGVGLGYQYLKYQQYLYNPNIGDYQNYPTQASIISPSVWARYIVWRNIFVQTAFEYDILHYSDYNYDNNINIVKGTFNTTVPCLLVGIGIRQHISERVGLILSLNYDVLQQPNSPYYGSIVPTGGIAVGF